MAVLVSTRTAGKVAVGAVHACFTCRPKASVSSAPDGLAGLCRRRTLKSLGASISGAVDVARVRRFARVRDLWGIPGIGHASTAVWWGPAFDDPWIVLHGASLDDRTPCERLRGIQDSNLAGVPVPLIWPGYPAAGACCTLHVHAKEQRQLLNADGVSMDDTAPYPRRTHAPPIPSDHHAIPVHRTPRGGGKMPLIHRALSVRSSACLEEWEEWDTRPSRKRKAMYSWGSPLDKVCTRRRLRPRRFLRRTAHTPNSNKQAVQQRGELYSLALSSIEPKVW